MKDTTHWYDGRFYDLLIAPNQDPTFEVLEGLVTPDCSVLDVGCGTGRLVFRLADRCRHAHGIDPSARNIRVAQNHEAAGRGRGRTTFVHSPLERFVGEYRGRFDIAITSFVIHELDERERIGFLNQMLSIADTAVLADYRVPRVNGPYDAATEVVEFLAGRDHYRGFRSFVAGGGLLGLLERAGREGREVTGTRPHTQVLLVRTRHSDLSAR